MGVNIKLIIVSAILGVVLADSGNVTFNDGTGWLVEYSWEPEDTNKAQEFEYAFLKTRLNNALLNYTCPQLPQELNKETNTSFINEEIQGFTYCKMTEAKKGMCRITIKPVKQTMGVMDIVATSFWKSDPKAHKPVEISLIVKSEATLKNEANKKTLECKASGIPAPSLQWTEGDEKRNVSEKAIWDDVSLKWTTASTYDYSKIHKNVTITCTPVQIISANPVYGKNQSLYVNSAGKHGAPGQVLALVLLVYAFISKIIL